MKKQQQKTQTMHHELLLELPFNKAHLIFPWCNYNGVLMKKEKEDEFIKEFFSFYTQN